MKKILVTGGAGFIGANFVKHMVDKYPTYEVFNLDALTYAGNLKTCQEVEEKPNYHFIHGDISNRAFIFNLFEKERFEMVVNFAAESHVDRSIVDPEIFLKTNVIGTQVLMDAARTFGVSRFHQVSTDEVYGDLPLDRPDLLFTEQTPLQASSPYSASKASADLLVLSYYRTFGLPVTNEPLPVYGDGKNVRDWLHVEDHCRAIDLILHRGRVGDVYNIGGRNERKNLDVVKTILGLLKKSESLITYIDDRPGHDLRYAIDATKIETELGWVPAYQFETGMLQTVEWYLNHREWWEAFL